MVAEFLEQRVTRAFGAAARGVGLIWGIDLGHVAGVTANQVAKRCFAKGLVIETCGRNDEVLKILPPLRISEANLYLGLNVIEEALRELVPRRQLVAIAGDHNPSSC
jgi:diaminobutyrate-2-oxoglutarate transaminase